MLRTHGTRKERTAALFLFFTNVLIQLMIWLEHNYDQISFDQFLFTLKSTSHGVYAALLGSGLLQIGLIPLILTAIEVWLYRLPRPVLPEWVKKHVLALTAALLTVSAVICGAQIHMFSYVKADSMDSEFIRDQYVNPEPGILHFPEQKRNLIYIFLESMESTYADPSAGGMITTCYIPELESLADENLNPINDERKGNQKHHNCSHKGNDRRPAAAYLQCPRADQKCCRRR